MPEISNESDRLLSDALTTIADQLAKREALTPSTGLALHCIRLAARLLFRERQIVANWHEIIHRLFNDVEIAIEKEGDL